MFAQKLPIFTPNLAQNLILLFLGIVQWHSNRYLKTSVHVIEHANFKFLKDVFVRLKKKKKLLAGNFNSALKKKQTGFLIIII